MRTIYLTTLLLIFLTQCFAQTTFWTEDFGTGCNLGQFAQGVATSNGTWTVSTTGVNDPEANVWYLSAGHGGGALGSCGTTGCSTTNQTLHICSNDGLSTNDAGALYNAGGLCAIINLCVTTNIRAESPLIDCTGRTGISLSFSYVENGSGNIDNATCWYFDGSTWNLLSDMPKTPGGGCGSNGQWTNHTIALPASADNNPGIKIGFNWTNNDDGAGSDPSVSIDNVELVVPSAGQPPVAGFTQNVTTGCDSLCVAFTDTSLGGTSVLWSFPGGTPSTSTQSNPTVCYNTTGTYDVTLISTNANGSDTIVKTGLITIIPTPVPNFTSTDQNLCAGDCIDFTDQTIGSVQSYAWTFQGGTPVSSSVQNPTNICYQTPGIFSVTLTAIYLGCSNTTTHVNYISVTQPVPPTITVMGDTLQSSAALTYQWYNAATGAIPAAIFQTYVATTDGDYYVCTTSPFGCLACSDTVHVSMSGIMSPDLETGFNLSPNPVEDAMTLSAERSIASAEVIIRDVTGRVVKSLLFPELLRAVIRLDDLSGGMYFLDVMSSRSELLFNTRVIKQ